MIRNNTNETECKKILAPICGFKTKDFQRKILK